MTERLQARGLLSSHICFVTAVLCKQVSTLTWISKPRVRNENWTVTEELWLLETQKMDGQYGHSVIIIAFKMPSLEMWSTSLSACEKLPDRTGKWAANYWKWPCPFFIHLINIKISWCRVAKRSSSSAESLHKWPIQHRNSFHKHTV